MIFEQQQMALCVDPRTVELILDSFTGVLSGRAKPSDADYRRSRAFHAVDSPVRIMAGLEARCVEGKSDAKDTGPVS
jgi:hypothetical protein